MSRHIIAEGFVLIGVLLIFGTLSFRYIEGLSFVDAFYFAGSTVTTLGYGDITPKTDIGKVFSVVYTLIGFGLLFHIMGQLFDIAHQKRRALKKSNS